MPSGKTLKVLLEIYLAFVLALVCWLLVLKVTFIAFSNGCDFKCVTLGQSVSRLSFRCLQSADKRCHKTSQSGPENVSFPLMLHGAQLGPIQ